MCIAAVVLLACHGAGAAPAAPAAQAALLAQLDALVDGGASLDARVERRITRYRQAYAAATSARSRFVVANSLFYAYRKYRVDSALYYARVRVKLAGSFASPDSLAAALMNEADGLKRMGRFDDALQVLDGMRRSAYTRNSPYYYYLYHSIYHSISQLLTGADEIAACNHKLERYRDSVAWVNRHDPVAYCSNQAEIMKHRGQYRESLQFLRQFERKHPRLVQHNAVFWFTMGDTYERLGDSDSAMLCMMRSAIIDKQSNNKTYTSLQRVAWMLYEQGDYERAYRYITCAMHDVIAARAFNRLSSVSEYMPIITTAYEKQQHAMQVRRRISSLAVALSALVMGVLLLLLYRRNKKLAATRHALAVSNARLKELNEELNSMNVRLTESNKIKEAYIAQLFNVCSGYIDGYEKSRLSLLGKLKSGSIKSLEAMLKNSTTSAQLKTLFHNFDSIFLELFPDFIERFNGLLRPAERISPKAGELLSPELRIYALVRLGINDSVKIAGFLHYSPQTVYNYRLKVRNKATMPKEAFLAHVKTL